MSCSSDSQNNLDKQVVDSVKGCWTGFILEGDKEKETFLVNFSLDEDSNLVLSTTIELDPRSRVWKSKQKVTIEKDIIHWENHQGTIDFNKNELCVQTVNNQNSIKWRYVCSPKWDLMMTQIEHSGSLEYVYQKPETWGYGYHWMQESISFRNQIYHSFFHPGYGGQILAVCPELKMVIAIMAGNYDSDSKKVNYDVIRRFIIPAVISSEK